MASRTLILGNEIPITTYSFPQYLLTPRALSSIPLPVPQHSVKITTTCFREYSHITSDSRASPGDTRPAAKDPVTLAGPPCSALYLYIMALHSNCLRISAFFLFTSSIQSFIILNWCESCIHTCLSETFTIHCSQWIHPQRTLSFHMVLIFNWWPIIRHAGSLTIKADRKQALNCSECICLNHSSGPI